MGLLANSHSIIGYTVLFVYGVTKIADSEEAMTQQTVAHAFAALMNGHDPDAVDGFVAEGYINHNPYVEDGREANRAFWTRWFAAFPDTRVTLEVEMRSLDIWRVRDGMAVEHWDELNAVEFFSQLGLLPPVKVPGGQDGGHGH
jgi:predicted SnoaL-like aldol condensation-catalyzing enzyme